MIRRYARHLVQPALHLTASRAKRRLQRRYGPIAPLDAVRRTRRMLMIEDALMPRIDHVRESGRALADPWLRQQLAGVELGTWSLGPQSLEFLQRRIGEKNPRTILEFGSGISTACLTHFASQLKDPQSPCVISIEQNEDFAIRARRLLSDLGLQDFARILVAPLIEQTIEEIATVCYDLEDIAPELRKARPEFVVIDGPTGSTGSRFGTLPLVRPYLEDGACFFLDDALRDAELAICQQWATMPGIEIEGIWLRETGLAIGSVSS